MANDISKSGAGFAADTNEVVIKVDKRYFRPSEVEQLLGDSQKAFPRHFRKKMGVLDS